MIIRYKNAVVHFDAGLLTVEYNDGREKQPGAYTGFEVSPTNKVRVKIYKTEFVNLAQACEAAKVEVA